MRHERREYQRLKLSKPILATMNGANALILDVGVAGAFLEHYGTAIPGDRFQLVFRWQGANVEFGCEVARSTVVRDAVGDGSNPVSHSGVRFTEAVGDSDERLQNLIATFIGHILDAQKENAAGGIDGKESPGATILAHLGEARRMRSRGFVSCRLIDGGWLRAQTDSPRQPIDGFTVGDHEDDDEIDALCRTYESCDDEGRDLIRLISELSALRER